MAVTIRIDGIEVVCDTPQEATEMVAALRKPAVAAKEPAVSHSVQPPATVKLPGVQPTGSVLDDVSFPRFRAFWLTLTEGQQNFIRKIAQSYPQHVVADQVALSLGLDINQTGWVRRKLNLIAENKGFNLDVLMRQEKVHVGESVKTAYTASELLIDHLGAVEQNGRVHAQ